MSNKINWVGISWERNHGFHRQKARRASHFCRGMSGSSSTAPSDLMWFHGPWFLIVASYHLGLAAIYTFWNTHKHTSMIQNLFLSGAMPMPIWEHSVFTDKNRRCFKMAHQNCWDAGTIHDFHEVCALKSLQVPSSDKFALGKLWVVLLLEMRIMNLKQHHHQTSLPMFIFHSSFFGGSVGSSHVFPIPPNGLPGRAANSLVHCLHVLLLFRLTFHSGDIKWMWNLDIFSCVGTFIYQSYGSIWIHSFFSLFHHVHDLLSFKSRWTFSCYPVPLWWPSQPTPCLQTPAASYMVHPKISPPAKKRFHLWNPLSFFRFSMSCKFRFGSFPPKQRDICSLRLVMCFRSAKFCKPQRCHSVPFHTGACNEKSKELSKAQGAATVNPWNRIF